MKTNFFELVASLSISGNLQLNIHQHESGTQTVTVLLTPKDPKITVGKTLPPMILKGSPQELDEAFFQQISQPARQTEKLFINAEAYQKELEKAKQQPKNDSGKKNTTAGTVAKPAGNNLFSAPTEEEQVEDDDFEEALDEQPHDRERLAEKQQLYNEAMEKVNALNGQMKYAEAIAQLPDPLEYPEKAEEIKNKGEALLKRQEMYLQLQQEV